MHGFTFRTPAMPPLTWAPLGLGLPGPFANLAIVLFHFNESI